MAGLRLPGYALLAIATAFLLMGCAATIEPAAAEDVVKPPLDKIIARMVSKGELDRARAMTDSLMTSKEPAEREIGLYWKAVTMLYRDQPDSAQAILEANQGKWTGGLRKVHSSLFLALSRVSSHNRAANHVRHDEAVRTAPDKAMQDRIESLHKEIGDLRAENARLATEKEKYQKLLKDLETIR